MINFVNQDMDKESSLHKSQFEQISKENLELSSKSKNLEYEFVKRGQIDQTIHLNKFKEVRFFENKEGLGFDNPEFLTKAKSRSLYDFYYIGKGWINVNFHLIITI